MLDEWISGWHSFILASLSFKFQKTKLGDLIFPTFPKRQIT
jgi:hypothetical protein